MTLNVLSDMKTIMFSCIKFFVFCFFLFNTVSSSGQDNLLIKEGRKYFHNGQEYKCKELGLVYRESEEALKWYARGRRNKKVATYLGISGLAFAGVGIGIATQADDLGAAAIIGLMVGLGIIIELVAVVYVLSGNGKLKKARKKFNFEMLEKFGLQSEMSLSFGGTKNGVGLILQF